MPLTIDMIEDKEFKIKVRGYDQEEVDEFLDEICDQIEAMEKEIAALQAKLNRANQAPAVKAAPIPAPVPAPMPAPIYAPPQEKPAAFAQEDGSESAQRLLARAQKVYDDTVAEANVEARRILREAQTEAEAGIRELISERDGLKEEIEMLKDTARDYRERFRRLVQDQQHVLDSERALFD